MNHPFKPYPHYKPSGIEWLGDVPAHWEVRRLKYSVKLIMGQSPSGYDCSDKPIGLPFLQGCAEFGDHSPSPVQFCHTPKKVSPIGAILMSVRAPVGRLNIADQEYGIGRGLCAILPNEEVFQVGFARYQLEALTLGLKLASVGSIYDAVSIGDVGSQPSILPPPSEQALIAAYLDDICGKIHHYVAVKERQVNLLEEYRRAIIHRAVTRGLDPNVPLKPTGIEWLGDIPKHWEVRRLKHWVGINEAVLSEATHPEYEFRYLEIGSVGTGTLTNEPNVLRFASAPSRARRIVKRGDTIVSTVRTYLKAVWFAEEMDDNLICSTGFAVLTPRQDSAPKFVSYVAQSDTFTERVTAESVGVAYPAIAESRLGSFHVCVPPPNEQAAIAAYLDKTTADIDTAIHRARREIALLREYRTALIAHAVTGKLDLREALAE